MKFERYQFVSDWKWLYFVPSVVLIKDEPQYCEKTFALCVHWLGWHFRWSWVEKWASQDRGEKND